MESSNSEEQQNLEKEPKPAGRGRTKKMNKSSSGIGGSTQRPALNTASAG